MSLICYFVCIARVSHRISRNRALTACLLCTKATCRTACASLEYRDCYGRSFVKYARQSLLNRAHTFLGNVNDLNRSKNPSRTSIHQYTIILDLLYEFILVLPNVTAFDFVTVLIRMDPDQRFEVNLIAWLSFVPSHP